MLTSEQLRDSFKYLFVDELPALKNLVRLLPMRSLVINIGAGAGTSGLAIMESRSDVRLITIDVQDASSPFGCLEAERDVMRRAGFGKQLGVRWGQLLGDSVEIGINWFDFGMTFEENSEDVHFGFPDMVFIDGDHSYEHARDDIQVWSRLTKEGGIIAVHDYGKESFVHSANGPHPKPWPGVDKAVEENLLHVYPIILHVDSLIAFRKVSS